MYYFYTERDLIDLGDFNFYSIVCNILKNILAFNAIHKSLQPMVTFISFFPDCLFLKIVVDKLSCIRQQ